jgi:hypothetical protein
MEKILLVGSGGEYGKKITYQLSKRYEIRQIDIQNLCDLNKIDYDEIEYIFIATPPATHNYYIEYFAKKTKKTIFCEKPLPILNIEDYYANVRIVDHYLYKKSFTSMQAYFLEYSNRIKEIHFSMQESKSEQRFWMIQNKYEGGVTRDMGHHLFAYIANLIGYNALKQMRLVSYNVEYFNGCSLYCDKWAYLEYVYKDIKIILEYGKEKTNKKSVKFLLETEEKVFFINDDVNYLNIIENPSMTLALKDASRLNDFIEKLIKMLN